MSTEDWQQEALNDAAEGTEEAQVLLEKTIVKATVSGHGGGSWRSEMDDCVNTLTLEMSDGTVFKITGSYGGYTGNSCDEYQQWISVTEVKE